MQAIGVEVLVGYGLTETSPVLTVRRLDNNVRGSIGAPATQHTAVAGPACMPACSQPSQAKDVLMIFRRPCRGPPPPPIPDTEIRIVDPANKARELPDGQQGIIMVNGELAEPV